MINAVHKTKKNSAFIYTKKSQLFSDTFKVKNKYIWEIYLDKHEKVH
jgi:hypothetical protein